MKQPSPLELMAFADDELDEPRASEVARWLTEHPTEEAGLDWHRALHEATGEAARASFAATPDFDLSDRIMAAIALVNAGADVQVDAEADAEADQRAEPAESGLRPIRRAPAEVTPLPAPRAPLVSLASRRAASRPLMVFGALVAAAAASLLWWRLPQSSLAHSPDTTPSQAVATALVASVLTPDDDVVIGDDGAAITSVDFGTQSGAIFYVPGQTAASAVVWVDDSDGSP